jgi:hypothetical protein
VAERKNQINRKSGFLLFERGRKWPQIGFRYKKTRVKRGLFEGLAERGGTASQFCKSLNKNSFSFVSNISSQRHFY